jgi:hypothetical protein
MFELACLYITEFIEVDLGLSYFYFFILLHFNLVYFLHAACSILELG